MDLNHQITAKGEKTCGFGTLVGIHVWLGPHVGNGSPVEGLRYLVLNVS